MVGIGCTKFSTHYVCISAISVVCSGSRIYISERCSVKYTSVHGFLNAVD